MKQASQLDRMLGQASKLGTFDSEGSFTIGGEAAIGKLANFQLPRGSAWILKIIQAAVALQATGIQIQQSNETTTFTFKTFWELQVEELKRALLTPAISGSLGIRHLAVGLRTVGFGDQRPFTLAIDKDSSRTLFGWNGTKLSQREEKIKDTQGVTVHLGVAFPAEDLGRRLGGLAKSKGRATTEYLEVVERGEACPIPLIFDGRRLDTLSAPVGGHADGQSVVVSVGWAAFRKELGFPRLFMPCGLEPEKKTWRPTDRFTDKRVFHFDGDHNETELTCLAKLRYNFKVTSHRSKHSSFAFVTQQRRSHYCWVKDGVIIQKQTSRWNPSAISFELYLSADDLPTDISGFRLQDSEELQRRKNLAREQLTYQAENTMEALIEFTPRPFTVHTLLYGVAGLACAVAAPGTVGKSFMGTFLCFSMALSAYDKKKIMDDCCFHLARFRDRTRTPEPAMRNDNRYHI